MSTRPFRTSTSLVATYNNYSKILNLGKAISVKNRLEIIKYLLDGAKTISELSNHLSLPYSNVVFHINVLEKAEIVKVFPSGKGYKVSLLTYNVFLDFNDVETAKNEVVPQESESYEIPVGAFWEIHDVTYTVKLRDKAGNDIELETLYDPRKYDAELIYTPNGSVTYVLPQTKPNLLEISISLEICSEAPFYANTHPSEIFFLINDVIVCSYICPGDFGGRKGNLNPVNYPSNLTQFGQYKSLIITKKGVYLDGVFLNNGVNIDALKINHENSTKLRIGNLPQSKYKGGFNIFGKHFGDYPQGIKVTYKY